MFTYPKRYDVIVVGAGHAGCEAALASARMGCQTLLLTSNINNIALMSCNPAIGGVGKGQLVREIDALGGEMGRAIDATGIQFRQLNTSKGPAVRSSRAQADRKAYNQYFKQVLEDQPNLDLKEGMADWVLTEKGKVRGVRTKFKEKFLGKTVILCPGTFLNGLIHIGLQSSPAGRMGDFPSIGLSECLKKLGLLLGRFKTGTPPRIDRRTVDLARLTEQKGDQSPLPFSFWTDTIEREQVSCYLTHTTPETHQIIRENLDRSPLYSGKIRSKGVRYCPSIEDKVVKFPQRESHQVFLEPEGIKSNLIYPNGLFTSLPIDIQYRFLHTVPGLERARIVRPGYGIEHDYVDPVQLKPNLECRHIDGLFMAGQINGTTGYEEAGAQGILAGINAALKVKDEPPLILDRSQAYIGVLIDDLVTKGTDEPYRMFTSRVEYRLILREDNAGFRLSPLGYKIGLLDRERYEKVLALKKAYEETLKRLRSIKLSPNEETTLKFQSWGIPPLKKPATLEELLRKPEITYHHLRELSDEVRRLSPRLLPILEAEVKYAGYIQRQVKEVENFRKMEELKIPQDMDFNHLRGLSVEVREKLSHFRPLSLGQASRISGITPSAISVLMVHLRRGR